MVDIAPSMVEIIRDFLVIHRSLTEVVARHREGQLRYQNVQDLVGDAASSLLFRFKERCHAMFRLAAPVADLGVQTGELFDLAVGSLFHEAMKLREYLYQHEVYRPRVLALRDTADAGASELIEEFDKICVAAGDRLEESVAEVEILLLQARAQLLRLITEQRESELLSRCLYQQRKLVAEVYEQGLDSLFEQVHGDAVTGYVRAANSFLGSAHFNGALAVLAEAATRAPERSEIRHCIAYAEGMRAFRDRDYARSVSRLSDWVEGGFTPDERTRLRLALSAISHVESLCEGEDRETVIRGAQQLAEQLTALIGPDTPDADRPRPAPI